MSKRPTDTTVSPKKGDTNIVITPGMNPEVEKGGTGDIPFVDFIGPDNVSYKVTGGSNYVQDYPTQTIGNITFAPESAPGTPIPISPINGIGPQVTSTAPLPPPAPPAKGQVVVRAGTEIKALVPTTMQEAWLFCNKMASSLNLPKAFYETPKGLPADLTRNVNIIEMATAKALQALQLGMEVGLPPAQAIQSILVQNGVGTIWGDAQLALVINSGKAEYVREYTEGGDMWLDADKSKPNPNYTWVCETKRKGDDRPSFGRFSIEDAQRANLWGKRGASYDGKEGKASTWITHPERMGKYKARAFCLRDCYADVLKGLVHSREEFEGETIDVSDVPAPAVDRFQTKFADPKYAAPEQPPETVVAAPQRELPPEQPIPFGDAEEPKA